MNKIRPLRTALMLALAAPALAALAAEPATDKQDDSNAPAKVAQAQDTTAPATNPKEGPAQPSEKIAVTAQREHYRGDVPLEDLPQAVQVITRETMQQIGAVNLNDILDIATSVARQNTFGGLWDGFAIRGFAGDPNLPSGYLVNGFNARGVGGIRDTSSIEKMEVLKGPGSALFGRGDPGGTVSITTLRPQFEREGSGTLTYGSDQYKRAEGDFTTPINDQLAVRINGAYEDADSFRDTIHYKREFLSPSVLWKIGKNTSLWYEFEWSHQEIPFDRGVVAGPGGSLGWIPNSRFLGEPGDGPTVANVHGHQAELQQVFANNWVLLLGGAYRTTGLNGIGENPELAVARQPYFTDFTTLSRQRRFTTYDSTDKIGRAEISGKLNTGPVVHHILAGTDYEDFELDRLQTRYRPPVYNGQNLAVMNAVNVFDPVYGNQPAANQNVFNDVEKDKSHGIYITDQMDLTQSLMLRLGGRYDWFKQGIVTQLSTLQPPNQSVTAFSPQVGLSYKLTESWNVYTMFSKGFRPNTGFDVNRNPFAPEKSKSGEVGVKYTSDDGNIVGTIATWKMRKTNVLTADPVNQGQTIAIGEAESKGVEVDLSVRLPAQVQVLLSYAYTDAYAASSVLDVDFGRVVGAGDPLINIPKHNGNLLVTKDMDLHGHRFTFGGGVKYVSSRLGETGTNFFLPSYTLVRLLANYQITKNWSVSGEVNNLFDKQYYPASYAQLWIAPGEPRQYQIRTSYHF